jgi:hypothetical protein
MLAVVHHLAGARVLVRRSAASKIRTAFQQSDTQTRVGERAGGGEPG